MHSLVGLAKMLLELRDVTKGEPADAADGLHHGENGCTSEEFSQIHRKMETKKVTKNKRQQQRTIHCFRGLEINVQTFITKHGAGGVHSIGAIGLGNDGLDVEKELRYEKTWITIIM